MLITVVRVLSLFTSSFRVTGSQNLTYKEMSIVFVIYCSDLSLAKHKNDHSSYNNELAHDTAIGKIAELAPNYSAHLITLNACVPHLQVDK